MTTRWLYLVRHGDASETAGLSPAGRRQAKLLAGRLSGIPFTSITHSPLQRAAETAAILTAPVEPGSVEPGSVQAGLVEPGSVQAGLVQAGLVQAGLVRAGSAEPAPAEPAPAESWDAAGDYIPFVPDPIPPAFTAFFDGYTPEGPESGWAEAALARFARPSPAETHDLIITHAFLVAWFVRDALGAPPARWLGIPVANCGLTVIRYTTGRPPALVQLNDLSHLPPDLHWTGFPPGIAPS
ncbi:histidine phosphatase family protein [Actinoplanes sp. NPDC051494]|uniref:histidine phosphatase family protein n=1 Tax=Actinoplanes sp. NPDC051494 TaxID=3363907 RepID=UPI0037A9491B